MAISRRIARPLLSSAFLASGAQALKDPRTAARDLRPWLDRVVPAARARGLPLPEDTAATARLLAGVQVAAATALALGKAPRTSATVLTATLVPALVTSNPLAASDPATKQRRLVETATNASLVGGLLLAALDTEGRPGLAWRARRATRDARRQARHLAKEATLEARLAAKSLG